MEASVSAIRASASARLKPFNTRMRQASTRSAELIASSWRGWLGEQSHAGEPVSGHGAGRDLPCGLEPSRSQRWPLTNRGQFGDDIRPQIVCCEVLLDSALKIPHRAASLAQGLTTYGCRITCRQAKGEPLNPA